MAPIQNPILPGFHPDPSIVRVGDDYYIATSTFEWFPGVLIYHSRDLAHWRLIARPLDRPSQLDMRGTLNNYGVWAPCLSWHGGTFYLVYSHVRYMNNMLKDCHNYLVTAADICGPWSEPVLLKGNFADYSLFHDGAKKWLVFPTDYTDSGLPGPCIAIQEFSAGENRPTGPVIGVFGGTELGTTEGPHLYYREGWYYLITAEGGTSFGHAVTVARSRRVEGPYQTDPQNPMLTSRGDPALPLQKAGHADLVQTQTGQWYLVHLCARPLPGSGRCPLGRETALQQVQWSPDGWLRLAGGGTAPFSQVPAPALPTHPWPEPPARMQFDTHTLDLRLQTLRIPLGEETLSLTERPGYLRLKGKESLSSFYHQALVARRQQHFRYTATTCVEFLPPTPLQAAGLVCFYNTYAYYYLRLTCRRDVGSCVEVLSCRGDTLALEAGPFPIQSGQPCYLRACMKEERLGFSYSSNGRDWHTAAEGLDASILTDEFHYQGMMNFTGAFVGLCCQDLDGTDCPADFSFFEYLPW